uniref:Uncharacterized protein n=1 Tax=Oryza glumipatula TaxID=40148 RepID=A0A0D9Y7P6_9ORYZ
MEQEGGGSDAADAVEREGIERRWQVVNNPGLVFYINTGVRERGGERGCGVRFLAVGEVAIRRPIQFVSPAFRCWKASPSKDSPLPVGLASRLPLRQF